MDERSLPDANLPPFEGGRSLMLGGAAAGAAGLVLTLIGGFIAPKAALYSYLIAFDYWLGLSLGTLALVMGHNAAGARWNVVVRRLGETMAAAVPLFIVLLVPLLLGARNVWIWIDPPPGLAKETVRLLQHKKAYLNFNFFLVRAVIYFIVWSALALLLRAWSVRQDESGEALLTRRQRKLSAPGLVLLILTATFASFDWLMSLQPAWFSTIFGLYVFTGGFVGSLAILCLIVTGLRSGDSALGKIISADHQHNLGKLLFAFVCFWAYMAFSQYMLIWAGNLPDEVTWIVARSRGVWRPVGILILLGHFFVPFFLLLSRDLKRSRQGLAAVAAWMLVIHYIDLYWIVMPASSLEGLGLHWTHLTAFIGVGGVSVAAALFLLRGVRPLPVRDPYLEDSLRYVQP